MANFSKSFNFRNGVQVDNDKFIVKPVTGLVGIGNTRPSELLDVAGNIRASGITSARDIFAGAGITVGYANSNRIMLDIDPLTGVSSITAQRFYGDGSNMSGIFAISVAGFVANSTNGGILTSFRKVGIGVTTPTDRFDVEGDSKFTGITTFVGISTVSGDLFSTNLGVLGNSNLKGNLTVGSAITVTSSGTSSKTVFNSDVDIIPTLNAAQRNFRVFNPVGEAILAVNGNTNITAVSGKFFNIDTTILRSLSVATGSTFTGDVSIGGNVTSDLTVSGLADLNNRLDVVGGANIDQLNVTGVSTIGGEVSLAGVATFPSTSSGDILFTPPASLNSRFKIRNTAGVDVFQVYPNTTPVVVGVSGKLQSIDLETSVGGLTIAGVSTLTGRVNATEINSPTGSQLKILQDGIQKFTTVGAGVSVSNTLRIGSVNGGTNNLSTRHGELSYGIEGGLNSYASRRSLNLVNTDNGNINFYLDSNNIGVNTGNFFWHKGTGTQLMALTYDGKLGVGITNPDTPLHVPGNAKFGSDVSVLNNLTVANNLTVTSGTINADVIGNLEGSVNATGVSTFSGGIEFSGDTTINATAKIDKLAVNSAGAGMTTLKPPFNTGSLEDEQIIRAIASGNDYFLTAQGFVGVRTDTKFSNIIVNGANANAVFNSFGVGGYEHFQSNHLQRGAVDFANAGVSTQRFMVPPKVTTTERNSLSGLVEGAMIYNTNSNRLELYTQNNNWVGIATVA